MTTLFSAALGRLGMSQSEYAAARGHTRAAVANWATGRCAVPDAEWPEIAAMMRARAAELVRSAREIEATIPKAA